MALTCGIIYVYLKLKNRELLENKSVKGIFRGCVNSETSQQARSRRANVEKMDIGRDWT